MQLRLLISNNNAVSFHFPSHGLLVRACACSWAVHQLVCWLEWGRLAPPNPLNLGPFLLRPLLYTQSLALPGPGHPPTTGADVWLKQ